MAIGQFGTALQDVLKRSGDNRHIAGKVANVDASQIGKIVKGTRKASRPVMKAAVEHYDDGQLFLAAVADVSGEPSHLGWIMWICIEQAS